MLKATSIWAVALGVMYFTYTPSEYVPPKFIFDYDPSPWIQSRDIVREFSLPTPDHEKIRRCKLRFSCSLVAEAVVYEARGEPLQGQYAVAWVVKNRAEGANRFPNSIEDVIHQPSQFSYLRDMHLQLTPSKGDWEIGYKVAYDTIHEEVDSPIGEATHYHADHTKPYWSSKLQYVASVGHHIYYQE